VRWLGFPCWQSNPARKFHPQSKFTGKDQWLDFPGLGFFWLLILSSCDYWMMAPLIFPSAICTPFPKVDLDMKA
jgi:hypothetical protein